MSVVEPTPPPDDMDAPLRLLAFKATHPSPAHLGISSEALERMVSAIHWISSVENPIADPEIRRSIRYLACLLPDEVPDSRVADIITQVISHPNLTYSDIKAVLECRPLEGLYEGMGRGGVGDPTPASKLREVASLLRYKAKQGGNPRNLELEAIATLADVSIDIVKKVSTFMGTYAARVEQLQDAALDWVAEDRSAAAFARRHNISEKYAQRLLKAARAV